jgi:hypothetical protein
MNTSEQARSILQVVHTTSTKFGLHSDSKKFSIQNEEWISVRLIMCIILPVYFYIYRDSRNILIIIEKIYKKRNIHPTLGCNCFQHIFTNWISKTTQVSTNKRLKSGQNFFAVLSPLRQEQGQKTFLHFKCLHGQHNTVSRATCCPRARGWVVPVYNLTYSFV